MKMKTATIFLVLFVLGASQASPQPRPKGYGAAKNLPGFLHPYIIGGEVVKGRQFPGQISLQVGGSHNCGGSIVNENYIVTAAHCSQYQPGELNVLSGTNSLVSGGTQHKVLAIHVHEGYNPSDSWHNDVAVMKVDPPFVFDDVTAPVALPPQGQQSPVGSDATVIGWGLTEDGEIPDDLRMVKIQIFDHDICNSKYQESDGLTVYPEQICASTEEGDKGSCN
ncbi:hypothetical protein J437_LFUL019164, partial [Ladona fulva]